MFFFYSSLTPNSPNFSAFKEGLKAERDQFLGAFSEKRPPPSSRQLTLALQLRVGHLDPVAEPTHMFVWVEISGLGELFFKTLSWEGDGRYMGELERGMVNECGQNRMYICKKFSKIILIKINFKIHKEKID